jgi:hypothetical protein
MTMDEWRSRYGYSQRDDAPDWVTNEIENYEETSLYPAAH